MLLQRYLKSKTNAAPNKTAHPISTCLKPLLPHSHNNHNITSHLNPLRLDLILRPRLQPTPTRIQRPIRISRTHPTSRQRSRPLQRCDGRSCARDAAGRGVTYVVMSEADGEGNPAGEPKDGGGDFDEKDERHVGGVDYVWCGGCVGGFTVAVAFRDGEQGCVGVIW